MSKTPTFIGAVHRNGENVLGFSGEQLDALTKRKSWLCVKSTIKATILEMNLSKIH